MNATQGLIFYALRCICLPEREQRLSWWQRLVRVSPRILPAEHKDPCRACWNAISDDEILELVDGRIPCIAMSTIGARVRGGYYDAAPPASGLSDGEALAGAAPNDQRVELSQIRDRVRSRPSSDLVSAETRTMDE